MIQYAKTYKLDLKKKNNHGETGFQIAKSLGNTDIVTIIERLLPSIAF